MIRSEFINKYEAEDSIYYNEFISDLDELLKPVKSVIHPEKKCRAGCGTWCRLYERSVTHCGVISDLRCENNCEFYY